MWPGPKLVYTEAIDRKFIFTRPYIFLVHVLVKFRGSYFISSCRWAVYGVSVNLQSMCVTYANRVQISYWLHARASEMNWLVRLL